MPPHTFPPPRWWTDLLVARVKTGRGRAPLPPGMLTQQQVADALEARYGEVYDKDAMSRCLKGAPIPIALAEHVSRLLGIPSPVYVAKDPDEASRLQAQRDVTERLEAAAAAHTRRVHAAEDALDAELDAVERETAKRVSGFKKPISGRSAAVIARANEQATGRRGGSSPLGTSRRATPSG